MYEGVLEAVRAGDLQLPARLPVPSDPAPEQPREPAEQARAAADQVRCCAAPPSGGWVQRRADAQSRTGGCAGVSAYSARLTRVLAA